MASYDLTVKIILLGDYSVNKAEILRALSSVTPGHGVSSLGMRTSALVEMMFVRDGKRVKAKVHDTAGAHGCVLLFDVMQRSTFEHLNEWQEELQAHSATDEIVTTLTGCNSHVTGSKRQVDARTGQEFANYLGVPYEEISVQSVSSVVHLLEKLIDRIVLKASRLPAFSTTIKPLDQKLEDLREKAQAKQKCACVS
ncbi:hypothetical protein BaRGS_00035706 [Batillaria attramentaria]|uniref:Uncharacterized protein n=1 Tax=Batillaria attramentaria TaxID=370345 RepID=A0ABD0JE43_9CAEN